LDTGSENRINIGTSVEISDSWILADFEIREMHWEMGLRGQKPSCIEIPSYIEITQLYRNSAVISKLCAISKEWACIEIRPYFDISRVSRNNRVISEGCPQAASMLGVNAGD
jgi:hypothetical protein